MRSGPRVTSKFTTATSAWTSVIQMLVLSCKISLDGKIPYYQVANGYVMEIRHQTVVQHTSEFSSDGPYVINTAPRRGNRWGREFKTQC